MKISHHKSEPVLEAGLVLSGGGVKGFAMAGAVLALEQAGVNIRQLAGTSSGAVVAALYAAGYCGDELRNLIGQLDLKQVLGNGHCSFTPGNIFSRWWRFGLTLRGKGWMDGRYLEAWLSGLLLKKKVRTFSDLPEGRLKVVAADIGRRRLTVFPDDLPDGGQMPVAAAVRMSASIPFVFGPVPFGDSLYVDGSLLSNTPLIALQAKPHRPVIALAYGSENTQKPALPGGPFELLQSLIETMLTAHDDYAIRHHPHVIRLFLPSLNVESTAFDLERKMMQALMYAGEASVTMQWASACETYAATADQWKRFGR